MKQTVQTKKEAKSELCKKRGGEDAAKRIMTLDVEKYQRYFDDSSLSEEEKLQFLEAMWTIILCFVDLGFSVEPSEKSCGQKLEEIAKDEFEAAGALNCKDQVQPNGALDVSEHANVQGEEGKGEDGSN